MLHSCWAVSNSHCRLYYATDTVLCSDHESDSISALRYIDGLTIAKNSILYNVHWIHNLLLYMCDVYYNFSVQDRLNTYYMYVINLVPPAFPLNHPKSLFSPFVVSIHISRCEFKYNCRGCIHDFQVENYHSVGVYVVLLRNQDNICNIYSQTPYCRF